MMNIPRSPVVDRATTVHNGFAHVVETYGKLLADLGAENHALRAEVAALRVQAAEKDKEQTQVLLDQMKRITELESKLQDHALREMAAVEACG